MGVAAIAIRADVSRAEDSERWSPKPLPTLEASISLSQTRELLISPLLEMAESDWVRLFAVNVKGAWLTAGPPATDARAGPGGRLVASSRAGKTPSRLHPTGAYATTKHAVVGLTRALAFELGPHRITVNAYCPGIVETPMLEQIDEAVTKLRGQPPGMLRTESRGPSSTRAN